MNTIPLLNPQTSAPVLVRWRDDHAQARQNALERALRTHPGRPLLLLHAEQTLGAGQLQRWAQHLAQAPADVDGITVLSNADERYNPFSDHPHPPTPEQRETLGSLVYWLADGWLRQAASFPVDRLLLRPAAAQRLALREHWPAAHDPQLYGFHFQLADDIYLDEPGRALYVERPPQRWQAPPSEEHSRLTAELRRVLDQGIEQFPENTQACLLHITHSWGGGVNRWLLDWCRHDTNNHHLILRSHGDWQRARHGSQLALYLYLPALTSSTTALPDTGKVVLLREFQLTPAISASRLSDNQYQAVLNWIIQRFPVQQLLISSLIGHSLDALRTDLPSVYALHDFYPAWPLLTVNPLPYRQVRSEGAATKRKDGLSERSELVQYDLQQALREQHKREFNEDEVEHWQRLSQAWREACQQENIRLVAPTQSAARIIGEMNPSLRGAIEVIPHGLPAWAPQVLANFDRVGTAEQANTTEQESAGPRPLRLLIPGRLSKHKGLEILRAALPQLRAFARITLLGCDRDGMHLLGENGVDIIANYEHHELPALIQRCRPDAALLLSVVPETFSYTLSEMWSLGVVPIATELGSFAERISDYETGILIPPQAEDLIQTVRQLYAEPEILHELRAHILALPQQDMAGMLAAYTALWPQTKPLTPAQPVAPLLLAGDIAELHRSRLWWQDERKELEELRDNLLEQLTSRTSWARSAQAHAERLQQQIEQYQEWLRRSDEQAAQARAERDDYGQQLQVERKRVEDLYVQQAALAQVLRDKQAEEQRLRELLQQERAQSQEQLQQRIQELAQRQQEIQQLQQLLAENERYLQQSQYYYQLLQQQYQQILLSRSWRITMPLRVAGRVARNLRQARAHLPWRWPWLAKRLLQSLIGRGLNGTLQKLQSTGEATASNTNGQWTEDSRQDSSASVQSPVLNTADSNANSTALNPVQLRLSAQPQLVVSLRSCASATALSQQLQALARLQQDYSMALVIHGVNEENSQEENNERDVSKQGELLDYLGQCSGFLLLPASREITLTPGVELEQVLAVLDSTQIQRPNYYLSLDSRSLCTAKAAHSLLQSLIDTPITLSAEWQQTRWARLGVLVDHEDHLLLPASTDPEQIAEHPLFHYSRPSPISRGEPLIQPLALDLAQLLVGQSSADNGLIPLEQLRQASEQTLRQALEQGLTQTLWLDSFCRARWQAEIPATFTKVPSSPDSHSFNSDAPTLLVVDAWVPTPDQDSGSLRMVQLLQVAQSIGWQVVFCSHDRSHRGHYTQALQRAGIEVWHAPYLQDFQSFLSSQGSRFNAVMLSRYYVAQELASLVRRYSPQAQIIFDTVDLHFLREEREAELKNSVTLKRLAASTRKQELSLVARCDTTLVVSPVEQQLLRELKPKARIEVLSNIHTVHGSGKRFAERQDILFVGGFQHPPNVDAMKWFTAEIWPQIHAALPEVHFHIIGSKMPEEIQQLQGPNLKVHGFVSDIEPYLESCRISVAPLRYGAGVKGKVNSSMSYGQPVVATTMAVEGMALTDGEETLVADEADAFAEAVVRLYQDEALWQKLADAGLENIRQHFSIAAAQQRLKAVLGTTATP